MAKEDEHLEDFIERKARDDAQYATAFMVLSLGLESRKQTSHLVDAIDRLGDSIKSIGDSIDELRSQLKEQE